MPYEVFSQEEEGFIGPLLMQFDDLLRWGPTPRDGKLAKGVIDRVDYY